MKTRIGWREKLRREQDTKIVEIPAKMTHRFGKGRMLIPRPLDVDALIRKVEKGKLITQSQIRDRLARNFGVEVTCPMTTGIFIRIAAEAAEEDRREGRDDITPYWRVVKDDGNLNPKLPGGLEAQATRLKEEGHKIELDKGRKPLHVKDFERYLQQL